MHAWAYEQLKSVTCAAVRVQNCQKVLQITQSQKYTIERQQIMLYRIHNQTKSPFHNMQPN